MGRGKILLIDDEPNIREFLRDFLEEREFLVDTASDGEAGVLKFEEGSYDVVVCDMLMPKMIGIQVLERIRKTKPDQVVIMMTGVKEDSMVEKARQLGCLHYIFKPVRLSDLETKILECFPG